MQSLKKSRKSYKLFSIFRIKSQNCKKQIIFWLQPLEMKKNMVSGCFGSFVGDFPPTSFLPFTQEYKRDEG